AGSRELIELITELRCVVHHLLMLRRRARIRRGSGGHILASQSAIRFQKFSATHAQQSFSSRKVLVNFGLASSAPESAAEKPGPRLLGKTVTRVPSILAHRLPFWLRAHLGAGIGLRSGLSMPLSASRAAWTSSDVATPSSSTTSSK